MMRATVVPVIGGRFGGSPVSPDRSLSPSRGALPLLAILTLALLVVDVRLLWATASDHVEGDVLIHLVFARNMARGHFFEYGYQQPSRAGTSLMWEGLLALVGRATGQSTHQEGFLLTARILSGFFLSVFAALFCKALCRLNVRRSTAVLIAALAVVNPITFYWCIASPMETALAMVVVALLLLLALRGQRISSGRQSNMIVLAALTVLALLVRPELVLLCGLTAIALAVCDRRPDWTRMALYLGAVAGGFAVYAGLLYLAGVSPIPNAGAARRLALRMWDTRTLPVLHIPWSPDSWLIALLFSPLVIGALVGWRKKQIGRAAPLAIAWLAVTVLFFSFYYYSSWRGRYLLPVLGGLAPLGVAGLLHVRNHAKLLRLAMPIWYVAICALCMRPLARHVREGLSEDATFSTADILPTSHAPLKLMVQEVQCAFYDPNLVIVSTDGLIDLKAYDGYKRGTTVRQFVLQEKPDLIGLGRFYLHDPDGLEQVIADTLEKRGTIQVGAMRLTYAGAIRGGGPVLRAEYPGTASISPPPSLASR